MTPNLKLNITTTIKKEQLKIIDILENRYASKSNFINYEDELNQADSDTKDLVKKLKSHESTQQSVEKNKCVLPKYRAFKCRLDKLKRLNFQVVSPTCLLT